MSEKIEQLKLVDFIKFHKLDIVMLQEHNIHDRIKLCKELLDTCHVFLNLAVNLKGGTAILINKKLYCNVISVDMSANSRIISMKLNIYNQILQLVNVYAESGSNTTEREDMFQNELLFYLRNNLSNVILGGDWNCVLSRRDTESDSVHLSKALTNTTKSLQLKDGWFVKHKDVQYTYIRNNHGSRLDRFYVKDLSNYIVKIEVIHMSFSDHSSVKMKVQLSNVPKIGRYYWKLNVNLLNDENIKIRFLKEWTRMTYAIRFYDTINIWWEFYAKSQIKKFFITVGREESDKKYGLIQFLEYKLNRLYDKCNKTGKVEYLEVKQLKDRINDLKKNILEGVKIRARISEKIEGEKVSNYLIGKQTTIKSKKAIHSIRTEENIIENLDSGIKLTNKDSIELYISKYFEKLYRREEFDEKLQTWFLQFVDEKVNDHFNVILNKEVNNNEIYEAIKSLNSNKSPGLDGLPNEFYLKYWDIIHLEVSEVIKNIILGNLLQGKQKNAVITLIPKDGDLELLKSWRPISLLCSDVKIVAKILANRLKPCMPDLISEDQYCMNNRSIVDCNVQMRDIMYYAGSNNLKGAIINLDWEKAFDRVSWEFLSKIMKKLGFSHFIIQWLMNLYNDITSSCLINGYVSSVFKIERGVRQGCPLSMLAYVIFQEPLYLAIGKSKKIKPLDLPCKPIKKLGFADDTTLFVKDDNSFLEVFNIINEFEMATNSKINIKKTKLYGIGDWKGRVNWPINGFKLETEHFKTLGITFSCDYDLAVNFSWRQISENIKKRISIMSSRYLTIYQRAIIVNSVISSKLWFTSHIYPLPVQYSKIINKEIFKFLWNHYNYNPIKRDTLYKSKHEGGIGMNNIDYKAKSIFVFTLIKLFLKCDEESLMKYFMAIRINAIFNIRTLPTVVCYVNTPFYEYAVDTIRKCIHIKGFPKVQSKLIYDSILPSSTARVESLYPLYDWSNIWSCLGFKYINVIDRPILFKYIHEILTTNKRLCEIRIKTVPLCTKCQVEDSNIHKFYYCQSVQECLVWVRRLIFYLCGMNIDSMLKILSLDLPKVNIKVKNTLCIIICSYITNTWFNRDNTEFIVNSLKAKIVRDQKLNMKVLKDKGGNVFTENYCKNDIEFIYRL